jgi:N-acetylneuraminic acid mutarotase
MYVWGGINFLVNGDSYDPSTDSWKQISTTGAPDGRVDASFAWTGSTLIIWGGLIQGGGDPKTNTGGIYRP